MRIPVPSNKLVAFTLAGAVLTAVVAGGLALPGVGLGQTGEQSDSAGTPASDASQQAAGAPTPNQDFTPAVQTQSGYEDEEGEEAEHEEDEDHEEGEDYEEDEEHEEGEDHEEDEEHEEGEDHEEDEEHEEGEDHEDDEDHEESEDDEEDEGGG